ncbi:hypothetical protein [Thalassococcus sp. S3]|uniref:hypothetical protein n=1 Tax=Thalassococcus sp. S3 TaxID=2017482 RepID=UPI0010243399|nr:hypothetical protein [Thalassococcus sp. S3]QBF30235.1 hypothetical protein CFI11_03250 [Thalassococcus sp. S3]
MLKTISHFFHGSRVSDGSDAKIGHAEGDGVTLHVQLRVLDRDPYLCLADERLRLISVFDDLRYDRADMDMLSGPMRRRVIAKLVPLGFQQVSGGVLENAALDVRMYMPKFRALGASPFDATRDTPRRPQDYYILTPTQTACQFIDHYPVDEAVTAIKALIVKHPINLLRVSDYLEKSGKHQIFAGAIGHLKFVQREAVEAEPLRSRRALR